MKRKPKLTETDRATAGVPVNDEPMSRKAWEALVCACANAYAEAIQKGAPAETIAAHTNELIKAPSARNRAVTPTVRMLQNRARRSVRRSQIEMTFATAAEARVDVILVALAMAEASNDARKVAMIAGLLRLDPNDSSLVDLVDGWFGVGVPDDDLIDDLYHCLAVIEGAGMPPGHWLSSAIS
jgi:hypothetical protein